MSAAPNGELSLFLARVTDLITRPPVTCTPSASAVEVARLLSREHVGSAVVLGADGRPIGIVTDRDLRAKVVAAGLDPSTTPASAVMSAPLVTTPPTAFAFEALLEMTRRDIHHLPIVEDGRLVGVLSSNDFLRLQTTHPVLLAREMAAADSLDALARLAGRTIPLVRRLVDQGATAYDVGQIVAELNDRLVVRVLELTAAGLAVIGAPPPPVAYCWLAFGSEARREQTLRTDQDNGLVYADPAPAHAAAAAAYYARFAREVIAGLVTVGFPRCPGDVMASNPRWCQPRSVWAGSFERWIERPLADELLAASIFFDLRPLAGTRALGADLADLVRAAAPRSHVFLAHLARDVVERPVPLTWFGTLGRGSLDVKSAGSLQLVGAARVAALEQGLPETNTVDRFRAAGAAGLYTPEETRELTDAYQHLTRLRLVHQLERVEAGATPDNRVDPARLSHADALLLRDALKTVGRVQAGLRDRFNTDRIMV